MKNNIKLTRQEELLIKTLIAQANQFIDIFQIEEFERKMYEFAEAEKLELAKKLTNHLHSLNVSTVDKETRINFVIKQVEQDSYEDSEDKQSLVMMIAYFDKLGMEVFDRMYYKENSTLVHGKIVEDMIAQMKERHEVIDSMKVKSGYKTESNL